MIRRAAAALLLVDMSIAASAQSSRVQSDAELTPQAIFKAASPAVVSVKVLDGDSRLVGAGSGFFVTGDGVIATNYHVLQDGRSAIVVLDSTTNYSVDGVVAMDVESDLALLKITGEGFPVLSLAADDLPEIGAPVYAIGNPLGLEDTLTTGLVSGVRTLTDQQKVIQTSAPISPGSSGGALLDAHGRVVGVTSSSFSEGQNLNFAIPTERLRRLLATRGEIRTLADAAGTSRLVTADRANHLRKLCKDLTDEYFAGIIQNWDASLANIELRHSKRLAEAPKRLAEARRAVEVCEAAVEHDGRDTELLLKLSHNYHRMASEAGLEWSRKAIKILTRAVELDPRSYDAYSMLCSDHAEVREYDSALTNCRTALSVAPVGLDVSKLREELAELPKRKQYDLQFRVPNTWMPWSALQSTINVKDRLQDGLDVQLAQFRLPAAGDDNEDVKLCFRLANADLPTRRLRERTASEYLGKWAEGFRVDPKQINVEVFKTGEITVTHFEIAGRCCGDSPRAKENRAILAAYLEAPDVAWIIDAWGPRATIDAARVDFRELLNTIRR